MGDRWLKSHKSVADWNVRLRRMILMMNYLDYNKNTIYIVLCWEDVIAILVLQLSSTKAINTRWRHWIYKMPVRYILSSVWVRLSISSQLSIIQSIIQYVGLCVFSLPTPLLMIERIYICLIIIIKSDVWTIIHCSGLGQEAMVCALCLSIFFWTIGKVHVNYIHFL